VIRGATFAEVSAMSIGRYGSGTGGVIGIGAVLLATAARPALAQEDFVGQANELYAGIARADRSDLVLLPVLAKIEPAPGVADTPRQAMLLPAGASGWDACVTWVQAAPQRAILDALHTVTEDKDTRHGMAFGQPYGQAAGFEALSSGLYTDLGDPPLLAGAKYLYLPYLDKLAALVHVEATRLASDGQQVDAVYLLLDWLFFCRQMANRELFDEANWGYLAMIDALERIRDVIYVDSRQPHPTMTGSDLKGLLEWGEQNHSALDIDRLNFPAAEVISFDQILGVTYKSGDGPNEDTFASTMARLSSKDRPLQLFSATAQWRDAMASQAGYFDMRDEGEGCIADWADHRWRRDWNDPFLKEPSQFEKLDPTRFSMLGALYVRQGEGGAIDFGNLQHERQRVLTEVIGTRTAIALRAYTVINRRFPPVISSLAPEYLPSIEADPYNPNRSRGAKPPLEYFVPWTINYVRPDERTVEQPPHRINIILGNGVNFSRFIGKDQFVLYSVGPNGGDDKARDVQNTSELNPGDYLLWPPVLSLHRQYMEEQKKLGE
jgi:hypothetical protein